MHDTGLADRIRARGVQVVEVAGWQTRGSGDFDPDGSVNHHTAGSSSGVAPSLAICTYGRSDLLGPLCQVLLGRDLVAYVIAAGRANHAGKGGWRGLAGNSRVHGLEIEHTGHGPSDAQVAVAVQIHAAFLEAPGQSRDARNVCQHFEWAPGRKVDFRALDPWTADTFRADVARALTTPAPQEDPHMSAEDVANLHRAVRSDLLRLASFVMGGRTNAVFNQRSVEDLDDVPGLADVSSLNELERLLAQPRLELISAAGVLGAADELAGRIIDRLPAGSVDGAVVKAAVLDALREGTG